jgi:hypothetical protein
MKPLTRHTHRLARAYEMLRHMALTSHGAPRSRWISIGIAIMAPIGIVVLALIMNSATRQHVQLDDGTIWVTSSDQRAAARFNVRASEADATVHAATAAFDVAQHGSSTVLHEGRRLSGIDPATLKRSDTNIAQAAIALIGGETLAVLDPASGRVWVGQAGRPQEIQLTRTPNMRLGAGGRIAVDHDGAVYGLRRNDGMVMSIRKSNARQVKQLGSLSQSKAWQADDFTVVDGVPVASYGSRLAWPDGGSDTKARGPLKLQAAPSDKRQHGWLAAAGDDALLTIALKPGRQHAERIPLMGPGGPTQPVSVGGCVHAAWTRPERNYLRLCTAGPAKPSISTLEGISETSELRFRVNHRMAILNDVGNGGLWNPENGVERISIQWSTAANEHIDNIDASETAPSDASTFADSCAEQSGAIMAVDDRFGVRAGKRRVITVLANDEQSDCSVLRITALSPSRGSPIRVSIVDSGRSVLVDAGTGPPGSATFDYTIDDGRGQTSSATVTIEIVGDSANSPPQQAGPVPQHDVEQSATFTTNAVAAFDDKEGDALTLVSAQVRNSSDALACIRPDGLLTFDAGSSPTGRVSVEVGVSDGTHTALGFIHFLVRPANTVAAFADACTVSTVVNVAATIDLRPYIHRTSMQEPTLVSFDTPDHTRIARGGTASSLHFTADQVGTYHVAFTMAQGDIKSVGLARIEVVPVGGQDGIKPVAVNDTAVLGADGNAIIEPLLNDIDPMGGVLAASSVHAEPSTGVTVTLVDHRRVYIKVQQAISRTVEIIYTASNAAGDSPGTITLHPPARAINTAMPNAADISLSVRTEGTVSADIRDHVSIPSGEFTLEKSLRHDQKDFAGIPAVSDRRIQYLAPSRAGTYTATYTIHDRHGNAASGTITWQVHASDAQSKAAPKPKDVHAHVAAGQAVPIEIPLSGIDEDGDDDMLLGLGNDAPRLGRITRVDATSMTYEAYPDSSGTDSFSYAIEDWTGQRAQARIRVGITRTLGERRVHARDDEIIMRPGVRATVPVTDNDLSSAGERLVVSADLALQGINDATAAGGSISFTAPERDGTAYIVYTVMDDAGLSDTATLTIRANATAPWEPPVARDYRVPASATVGKRTVEVDAAALIANPSGSDSELRIDALDSSHADVKASEHATLPRIITIELTPHARIVPYRVTNTVHNLSSTAFIHVPAYGIFPPELRPKAPPLTVHAGETLTIAIADHVRVGAGKNVSIDATSPVSATKNANDDLRADAQTLRFTAVDGYYGPASITFSATDGGVSAESAKPKKSESTHGANTATLTLPITILADAANPPVFAASTVEIAAGDGERAIELSALMQPHGDAGIPYSFSGGVKSPALDAAVSPKGRLTVRARPAAPIGARVVIPVSIAYPGGTMKTGVSALVVASRRALAQVPDRQLRIAAGSSASVDLLDGAYNPFPDTPLTVVKCVPEDEELHADCAANGRLRINASAAITAASRTLTVNVHDATRSKERQVSAIITISTIGRPDPPKLSSASAQAADSSVTLRWSAANTNGSAISDYRILWDAGSLSCGAVTVCRIDGLTNGKEYTFRVQALNDAGWSGLSASVTAKPDRAPSTPRNVRVEAGYRQATVHWEAPAYEGSAPEAYIVTLSGSNGWRKTATGTASPITFSVEHDATGDGAAFSATVVARSRIGQGAPSPASPQAYVWSDPDPPSIALEQEGNAINAAVSPRNQHNAGCSAITLEGDRSSKTSCGASVVRLGIARQQFWKPFTVVAVLHPGKSGTAQSTASASITPQYALLAPQNVSLHGQGKQCIVTWRSQGERDGFIVTASGLGTVRADESEESAIFELDPWQRCALAEVVQTLNGRSSPASGARNDYQYQVPAAITPPIVMWAVQGHGRLTVTEGSIETWGQPASIRLAVTAGAVRREYPWQPGMTEIDVSNLPDASAYTWSVIVTSSAGENGLHAASQPQSVQGIRKPLGSPVSSALGEHSPMLLRSSARSILPNLALSYPTLSRFVPSRFAFEHPVPVHFDPTRPTLLATHEPQHSHDRRRQS